MYTKYYRKARAYKYKQCVGQIIKIVFPYFFILNEMQNWDSVSYQANINSRNLILFLKYIW